MKPKNLGFSTNWRKLGLEVDFEAGCESADAENSTEPVMNQAWRLGFEAGWFAALQVARVSEDSPLRDPGQIPFSIPTPAKQNPPVPIDEEETASIRELVEQIDAHVELDDMEATSVPHAGDQPGGGILPLIAD